MDTEESASCIELSHYWEELEKCHAQLNDPALRSSLGSTEPQWYLDKYTEKERAQHKIKRRQYRDAPVHFGIALPFTKLSTGAGTRIW